MSTNGSNLKSKTDGRKKAYTHQQCVEVVLVPFVHVYRCMCAAQKLFSWSYSYSYQLLVIHRLCECGIVAGHLSLAFCLQKKTFCLGIHGEINEKGCCRGV